MDPLDKLLKKYKRKGKKIIAERKYTEFFVLNDQRNVVDFLGNDRGLLVESFFKELLPEKLQGLVELHLLNDSLEPIQSWYYHDENLIVTLNVSIGVKSFEIKLELDIENFMVSVSSKDAIGVKNVDISLLNQYIISFLVSQAENVARLASSFKL